MSGAGDSPVLFDVFGGCKMEFESGATHILDPCNCSTYYEQTTVLKKERKVCDDGQLWNQDLNQCRSSESVLQKRLCSRESPWDRCVSLKDTSVTQIRNKCIKKGYYIPEVGGGYSDSDYEALPHPAQLANVQLALMAMVAGAVIALLLVAIIHQLCKGSKTGTFSAYTCLFGCLKCCKSGRVGGRVGKSGKASRRVGKKTPNVTEGDQVSVNYEDIDSDDEDTLNTGYKAMSKEELQPTSHVTARQPPPVLPNRSPQSSHVTGSTPTSSRPLPPQPPPVKAKQKPPPGNSSVRYASQEQNTTPHRPGQTNMNRNPAATQNPRKPILPKKVQQTGSNAYLNPVSSE